MTFLQAAAFQWINPKAWVMALTAVATYTLPDDYTRTVVLVAAMFGIVCLPDGLVLGLVRHRPASRAAEPGRAPRCSISPWGRC